MGFGLCVYYGIEQSRIGLSCTLVYRIIPLGSNVNGKEVGHTFALWPGLLNIRCLYLYSHTRKHATPPFHHPTTLHTNPINFPVCSVQNVVHY